MDLADWKNILKSLQGIEGLTWARLKEQSGGRGRKGGTNHHHLNIDDLCKEAKARWVELKLDEYDQVFSLRLSNTLRIYGLRDGRALKLIWCDPHHGNHKGVWPFKK